MTTAAAAFAAVYTLCKFMLHRATGRVLVMLRDNPVRNGACVEAVTMDRDGSTVPMVTWYNPAKPGYREISESEARAIAPDFFAALVACDRSPEYRAMHPGAVGEAFAHGRVTLQPASPAVLDWLESAGKLRRATEGKGGGYAHRARPARYSNDI